MSDTENTILTVVSKLPDLWRQRADSLAEYTEITRNEYITLVEDHLTTVDFLPDVLDRLQVLLGANMLAAISLIVGVPNVDVVGTLDKVATKRDPLGSALGGAGKLASFLGRESVSVGLPSYDDILLAVGESSGRRQKRGKPRNIDDLTDNHDPDDFPVNDYFGTVTTNANGISIKTKTFSSAAAHKSAQSQPTNTSKGGTPTQPGSNAKINSPTRPATDQRTRPESVSSASFGRDVSKMLNESNALSTGKQFEVMFERDGNRTPVMMTLRLLVNTITSEYMRTIIGFSDSSNTFKERRLRAKAGELGYIKDLMFCNDLIEQARKNRFKDTTGFYRQMMEKRSNNWLSGLLSMNWSLNNASAIIVVDQNTVDDMVPELGGSIEDFAVRQRIFKDTLTVYIVVVDVKWREVTIYTRGMDESTKLRERDFSSGKGGKTGNVDDIISAYRSGTAPTF